MKKRFKLTFLATICYLLVLGQTQKIFVSDTLVIECDTTGVFNEPYIVGGNDTTRYPLNIYFISSFSDYGKIFFNGKKIFQGLLKTNLKSGTVLTPSKIYITPNKLKKEKLLFDFPETKFKIESNLIKGYNHLYVYKEKRKLSLLYTNTRLFFD